MIKKFFTIVFLLVLVLTLKGQIIGSIKYANQYKVKERSKLATYFEYKNLFFTEYNHYYYTPGVGFGIGLKVNPYFYFGGALNLQVVSRKYDNYYWNYRTYAICPTVSLLSEIKVNILNKPITPTFGLKLGANYHLESGYDMNQNVYINSGSYINLLFRINAGMTYNISKNRSVFFNLEYYPLINRYGQESYILALNLGYVFGRKKK